MVGGEGPSYLEKTQAGATAPPIKVKSTLAKKQPNEAATRPEGTNTSKPPKTADITYDSHPGKGTMEGA